MLRMSRWSLFLLVTFLSANSRAQRIIGFNLYQVPKATQVTIKFTVAAGSPCNGFSIMHSVDSINYVEIFNDPGICGGAGVNEDKSYTDPNPAVNAVNYYRIQLFPFEQSAAKSIFISTGGATSMIVYPNPLISDNPEIKLKLLNIQGSSHVFGFLVNQNGITMANLDLQVQGDLAMLNTNGLDNGVYVIWLVDEKASMLFRAKLVVSR
jgi:hypothetical protein